MLRSVVLASLLAACGDSDSSGGDVVGPFTGETRRFVIEAIEVPTNNNAARALGGDLDGDRTADNQLGMVIGTLHGMGNGNTHAHDMIAAGSIDAVLEITADDFFDDPTVGVRLQFGDGGAIEVGGTLAGGVFVSNRTTTTSVPGRGAVVLPVFADADPSRLPLEHVQIELVSDGANVRVLVQGAVDAQVAADVAYDGALQMIAARPGSHIMFMRLFDKSADWQLTREEFVRASLIESLLAPDVELGGRELLSIGFGLRARPCTSGRCLETLVFDHCFDRKRDGTETDVDCGGSCRPCERDAACAQASDCESRVCEANGRCAPPSCTNGFRDGFETDRDCGSVCGGCALGQRCFANTDCASAQCGPPCPQGDICFPGEDTCEVSSPGS